MSEEPVHISDLNQYLYCPRRLYYLLFYNTQGLNQYLLDGRLRHQNHGKRGGWIHELYLRSDKLFLQGKIDVVESKDGRMIPVEKKRGYRYFENDAIQLTAYAMLLEEKTGEKIDYGFIYLYGVNRRERVEFDCILRNKVRSALADIKAMSPSNIPDFTENRRKCEKCSVVSYCMPYESEMLGE